MNARLGVAGLVAALQWLCASVACGAESYYDTARVVAAEPVVVTHTVRDPACGTDTRAANERKRDLPSRPVLGDVRSANPGVELGAVLRNAVVRPVTRACGPVTERRIVGFDVTMRYGDEQWVRRMARDPGKSVRVRVSVEGPSASPSD